MTLKVTRGIITRPQKVVMYGPEGIGKTTLASEAPEPLFIDTESGTAHLNVARIEYKKDWESLLATIQEVAKEDCCKTLVIDTIDWAEQLASDYICQRFKQPSIESFGYGKGYTYLAEEMERFLGTLDEVIASGKNVILTAHAKMRKQELPDEAGQFDRWELKLTKQSAPLVKEWADAVLFINYKTMIVATEGANKAQGGKRVIYTTHHPCWDAKNRHNLKNCLDLSYDNIAEIFNTSGTITKTQDLSVEPQKTGELRTLMQTDGITEEQLRDLLSTSKFYDASKPIEDYSDKLIPQWQVIVTKIQNTIF